MKQVLQFKIVLCETEPAVWRRIQVADTATFWDLHVAIQDAMGWEDYHLHMFRILQKNGRKRPIQVELIGIPDGDYDDDTLADWDTKVTEYIASEYKILYEYDFGDSWEHEIIFEGEFERITGNKYPCCLDGAMKCPPEDVGGIPGYYHFIEIMTDKKHPEYRDMLDWHGGKFDPEKFDAKKVKFSNAKTRLKNFLSDEF